MIKLTVSASGTDAIRQFAGKTPDNLRTLVGKDNLPAEGSPYLTVASPEEAKPAALIRPVKPEDLLDLGPQDTGRFLDVTA